MESVARRSLVRVYVVMLIGVCILAYVLLCCTWQQADVFTVVIMGGALVAVFAGGGVRIYLKSMRQARSSVEKWGEREIVYLMTDDHLRVTAPQGEMKYPWPVFEKLVRHQDVWLLFTGGANFLILPAGPMADGPGEFLVAKIRAAGGKVR